MKVQVLVFAALAIVLNACGSSAPRDKTVVVTSGPRVTSGSVMTPGPPPHAPAHGYRHHHAGYEMIFDSGLGMYVVTGTPHTYYWKGDYYRPRGTAWLTATEMDGRWTTARKSKLPQALRNKKPKVNSVTN